MRTLLILLVLALAVVGVLFALGFFEGSGTPPEPEEPGGRTPPVPTEPGESALLTGPAPSEEPDTAELPLTDPLHILLLAGVPERLNLFLAQSWATHPKMQVLAWAPPLEAASVPPPGTLPGALEAQPAADLLADEQIDVLVVHDFDPAMLDDAFWQAVAARVRDGRLGLYVQPGVKHGAAMMANAVLAGLVPVTGVAPLEGSDIPGVFGRLVAFDLTDQGARHPATRLVAWPRWSEAIWKSRTAGEFPWGTAFCYPVTELREGSQVLLRCQPPRQPASLPAFVVGPDANGRVIWNGAWELGPRKAYGQPKIAEDWTRLVRNWVIWLGGRVTE